MLNCASYCWVVVRLAGSLSSVRNRRVSGVWMAWDCRLLALASNCNCSILFIVLPKHDHCLAGSIGILCCLPTEWNSIVFTSLPPGSLRGVGWTIGWPRVPGVLHFVVRLPWPMGLRPYSWMRIINCGRGVTASIRPSYAFVRLHERLPHPSWLRSRTALRGSMRLLVSLRNATWLILPVVICLSQRLSHACVSMN